MGLWIATQDGAYINLDEQSRMFVQQAGMFPGSCHIVTISGAAQSILCTLTSAGEAYRVMRRIGADLNVKSYADYIALEPRKQDRL